MKVGRMYRLLAADYCYVGMYDGSHYFIKNNGRRICLSQNEFDHVNYKPIDDVQYYQFAHYCIGYPVTTTSESMAAEVFHLLSHGIDQEDILVDLKKV